MLRDQLELSASLIEADPCPDQNLESVGRGKAQALPFHAEHGAADLAMRILEGEIDMARSGLGQVGNFPFHPEQGKTALQYRADLAVQPGDGVDITLGLDCGRVAGHRGVIC